MGEIALEMPSAAGQLALVGPRRLLVGVKSQEVLLMDLGFQSLSFPGGTGVPKETRVRRHRAPASNLGRVWGQQLVKRERKRMGKFRGRI